MLFKIRMQNNSNSLRNFEVKQKLGSGSYGVIFKAINKTDKSVCVLKQINLARMSDRAKKNAVNEATIMGKLKHPFIVSYCESFTEDRNLNIIMEFCDGGDLSYFLKQQNKKYLKQSKIWMFFIQICMGLEHIHKNKILHRDIKTLNIFLHKNQMVKIGDLGVAKMLNSNDFAHTMVGTPFYLSPELCQQKPYNEKSDIWALGCLLYELCTYRHPFQAANQASLILKIIRGKYSPIPEFYSAHLREMIDWCLQRDYKRRPTAQMILSKPHVKQMIQEFEYHKIVEQFTRKNAQISFNPPKNLQNHQPNNRGSEKNGSAEKSGPPSTQRLPLKPTPKVIDSAPAPPLPPKKPVPKVLDEPSEKKPQLGRQKQNQNIALPVKKQQSAKVLKEDLDNKPKVLFGAEKPENKADFIHNLELKMDKKSEQQQKLPKKGPTYFQIPWKNDHPKSQLDKRKLEDEDKVIIHNKNALLDKEVKQIPVMPMKYSEPIHRIKMDKKVEPKVYEIKPAERPKGIIKSGGFSSNPISERKKSQSAARNSNQKVVPPKQPEIKREPKGGIVNSMRNLRKQSEERPSYLAKKRQSNPAVMIPHYPPRSRKHIQIADQQKYSKPPKHLPHRKTESISRYTEVTKEEMELVENLPDTVMTRNDSDSEQETNMSNNNNFKLNEVDHDIVLKRYEAMIDSKSRWKNNSDNVNKFEDDEDVDKINNGDKLQQEIEMQSSEPFFEEEVVNENLDQDQQQQEQNRIQDNNERDPENQEEFEEDISDGDENFYEVNKFDIGEEKKGEHLWSYDEEPQLPMMEEIEGPLFEEANPYLVDQKTQQENLEDKKIHLQLKLKENIKRQDEINKLMQMKIAQCRTVVPKGFQEILAFFRTKINMDREYTDEDERQVESFLSKRNLTDQRKFQNIYKIMHFQMELQNTRRIIQSICKKLNQLEDS